MSSVHTDFLSRIPSSSLDSRSSHAPSLWQQLRAVIYKNALLQLRSRTVLCGFRLGGLASVAFEVLLPVLFIGAMCLVTRLPTITTPAQVHRAWLLQDATWARHKRGAAMQPQLPGTSVTGAVDLTGLLPGRWHTLYYKLFYG